MNMRTVTALIALILFHASTAWAVSVPVNQCPEHAHDAVAMQHDAHGMHDVQASVQSDCCDDISSPACQLHCASATPCVTEVAPYTNMSAPVGFSRDSRLGQRLPPHEHSLLRPPQPLS